ncbi:MAG: hypothetical protein MJ230_01790 [bacterium]|nr:hypothetical protein [bacterium]
MKTGCLKNKPDNRDYIYMPKTAKITYPNEFILHKVKIKNQGDVNSCVAHAIATIKEVQEYYESKKDLEFSVGWIYGYRVGNQDRGAGMYPREALNNICKYGDVLVSDFPENKEYKDLQSLIEKRKVSCLQNGRKYRCKCYAKVTSVDDVRRCIFIEKSPVLIVVKSDALNNVSGNGIVPNVCRSNELHAMAVVGWKMINNSLYYIVHNSWGANWGDKGYCYIHSKSSIIDELYTVTDESNVKK